MANNEELQVLKKKKFFCITLVIPRNVIRRTQLVLICKRFQRNHRQSSLRKARWMTQCTKYIIVQVIY